MLTKKTSKLSSVQGGPFNTGAGVGQNRHIDLDIPASYGVISLKDTFIQMRTSMEPSNVADVLSYFLRSTANIGLPLRNVDLIRNCWLESKNYGRLEDIKRVNVLRHNLHELSLQSSAKLSIPDNLYNVWDLSTVKRISPYIEIHKNDGFNSRLVDVHLRIAMSDLFQLGSLEEMDVEKMGGLRVHLELERKNYFSVEVMSTDDVFVEQRENECLDISGATSPPAVLTPQRFYNTTAQIPFYQSMPVLVSYSYTDVSGVLTPVVGERHTIQKVDISKTVDPSGVVSLYVVEITLDSPLSETSSNNNYVSIALGLPNPNDTTFNILTCELAVCHYENYTASKMDGLEYMTWSVEEFSNGSPNLSKIFELEPECVNVLVMFDNNTSPLSNYQDKMTYRLRVDNDDVYDYDIEVNREAGTGFANLTLVDSNDGLHYDALNRVFMNSGLKLKSLIPAYDTRKGVDYFDELLTNRDENKILVLGTPTNLTPNYKLFQVVIENKKLLNKTNIDNIILYKQIVRSIKL